MYDVDGDRMRMRTDDPLVLWGGCCFVWWTKDQRSKHRDLTAVKKVVRILATGETKRLPREDIDNLPVGSWGEFGEEGS